MGVQFTTLASAQIQDKRSLVISECTKGGFTLAQKIMVEENGRQTNMFLKNAIRIDDLTGLENLRDALNVAIETIEKK